MRVFAGLLIVFVVALPGQAQAPPGKAKLTDYYPLKPGTKWAYQVDNGSGTKSEISNRVAKNETIDGKSMALVETIANGNVVATEHLTRSAEGVFRCRYNGMEVSPPICIFKYPVKEEATWTSDTTIGTQNLKVTTTSGKLEEVTTPAGKYQTAPVVTETAVGGTKIKAKIWFAPGVGMVKQDMEIGDKSIHIELVKFEPSK